MGCGQTKPKPNISQRMIDLSNFKHYQLTKFNISTNFELNKDYDINKNPIKRRRLIKKLQSQMNSMAEISVNQR